MKKDWMIIESELDEDQIKVLNAVNDKSCIVSGCAGSGKSILALIKAQRIQREKGNNYQIIVFTKALCKYMNAGRKELKLNNEFDYHWWWKNRKGCPSSDYVIVDEIQDFSEDEIKDFIDATKKNFFFFGDTAQSIYEGLKDTVKVEDINYVMGTRAKTFELYRNYRLPKTVAKAVQYVGVDLDGFDIDTYRSKESAMPRFVRYNSFEEQIEAISRLVKGGSVDDVGILLPHNEAVKDVHDLLKKKNINHELKYDDKNDFRNSINNLDFTTDNPKVMTYHSAKGLQFGTVFLPGVDEKREDSERKALYVAMTRTYRNLFVMYSGSLPFPLSKVPSNLYKTTEKDVVEDI
jgi:superfamily I DNA/RNA helicase